MDTLISRHNVGRIAERIVSNELEARGFRITDLNREGLAANADLLAAGHDKVWQVQVKGSSNRPSEPWWVQYGFCTEETIERKEPMFNRRAGFYKADIIVLVAVRSPRDYCCVVLPLQRAEEAAQKNLDRYYRGRTREGTKRKPGKVWIEFEPRPNARTHSPLLDEERKIIREHKDAWKILVPSS